MRMLAKNAFFEAYKIGHNVVQIKGRGGEQCYLLESADKAILIDGLVGVGSLKEFVSELTDKQLLIGFRDLIKKLMTNPALTLR